MTQIYLEMKIIAHHKELKKREKRVDTAILFRTVAMSVSEFILLT